MKNTRVYTAVGLWVLAVTMMVYGTLNYARDHTPAGLAWGVFIGIVAALLSSDVDRRHMAEKQAVEVEQIIEVVDALHTARSDVSRLPTSR